MRTLPLQDSGVDDDDADIDLAHVRDNVRKFWERLPAVVVVSYFLFEYIGTGTGALWLACVLIFEGAGYLFYLQILSGRTDLQWAVQVNTFAISLCWVAHAAMLWQVGTVVPQIAAIMGLFSVSLYAVMSSYRNQYNMLALLTLPLGTLCFILVWYLWENASLSMAFFGSLSTVGVAALVVMNGLAMSRAYYAERRSTAMLKASESKYRAAAQNAEAASIAKSEFLANVSHELRTPLTCIIGFSGLLCEDRTLGERAKDHALRIQDGGRALLGTINDVLDYSEIEHGALTISPVPTLVADVAEEVISLLKYQANDKGNTVELACSPLLIQTKVMVDPIRLRQLLINLLGNAIKFTHRGRIKVSLGLITARLRCEISDTGIGIGSEDVEALFKRFSQVDNSITRVHGGTGLGLAICKGIVDAANGEIAVTSEKGSGSTFWFELPAPTVAVTSSTTLQPVPQGPLDRRVLVVDDSEAVRNFVGIAVRSFGGVCVEADCGEAAVDLAVTQRFDLILMDLRMPGMGGKTATKTIRSREAHPRQRIFAFTGEGDVDGLSALVGQGFDGVLRKPITVQQLRDFIVQQGLTQ